MTSQTPPVLPAVEQADAIIQMRGIVKTFKNAAGEFTVLKGIDLTLQRGEFVSIVGKSGSGKSTLLNMLTGIDHPTSGQVVVDNVDIYAMTESERSLWRGRNLGIVFQFFQLLPMLSLLENVMLPMDYVNMYAFDERPQRAMELLELVGLEKQAHKLPLAVSTGQQQSAAIARALSTNAPILVADEPTGNLDSRAAGHIIDLFDELAQRGKTIVMVTHDPSMTRRTSRTIIISDGELVDETIAKALPLLSHRLMRELSRKVEHRTVPPNQTIIQRKQPVDKFFMIASGQVEVVLEGRKADDTIIARLGPGEFFGEIELTRGGKSIASVRVTPEGPVELLALSRDDFNWLMNVSPLTSEAMTRIIQSRLEENRTSDRRKRRRWFR
ncbi:MAG: ATP-binding cassette domain-containing protein [Chloroflexi bacterium]|nr:ATP-binding cassette domain-containing protein [Chloroflexota bacterium]